MYLLVGGFIIGFILVLLVSRIVSPASNARGFRLAVTAVLFAASLVTLNLFLFAGALWSLGSDIRYIRKCRAIRDNASDNG